MKIFTPFVGKNGSGISTKWKQYGDNPCFKESWFSCRVLEDTGSD